MLLLRRAGGRCSGWCCRTQPPASPAQRRGPSALSLSLSRRVCVRACARVCACVCGQMGRKGTLLRYSLWSSFTALGGAQRANEQLGKVRASATRNRNAPTPPSIPAADRTHATRGTGDWAHALERGAGKGDHDGIDLVRGRQTGPRLLVCSGSVRVRERNDTTHTTHDTQ